VLIDVILLPSMRRRVKLGRRARLADAIDRAPGVHLRGIMGYEGRIRR
jgi:D-serine deaminase-like pyridoxal phosphate-dependent protein